MDAEQLRQLMQTQRMRSMLEDGLSKPDQVSLTDLIRAVPLEMIHRFTGRGPTRPSSGDKPLPQRSANMETRICLDLHTPGDQNKEIDQLFEHYQEMRRQAGLSSVRADAEQFRRFISHGLTEIKSRQNCRFVRIEILAKGNRVEINAVPVR
jgi:hypothetical protein